MHPGSYGEYADVDGWTNYQAVRFHFWVRAAVRHGSDGNNSQSLAAKVAALLFGILKHPDCSMDLARKNVTHLRPRPAMVIPMIEYACRQVVCSALLVYTVSVD